MQDSSYPLLLSSLIDRADKLFPNIEIFTRTKSYENSSVNSFNVDKSNYSKLNYRSKQLALLLLNKFSITYGSIIATLSFNTIYHLESYYAIQGLGCIIQTLNPRFTIEQLIYCITHSETQFILVDPNCYGIINKIVELLDGIIKKPIHYIMMCNENEYKELNINTLNKNNNLFNYYCYDNLLLSIDSSIIKLFNWPKFSETTAAALCYTSGSTGLPKGVLYSHRSLYLSAQMLCMSDVFNIHRNDTILQLVPLFHVNGWGLIYSATMVGARLCLPSNSIDSKSFINWCVNYNVTFTAGVPTIFIQLLEELKLQWPIKNFSLNRVIVAGSTVPKSLFIQFPKYNINIEQAWGMTEICTVGLLNKTNKYNYQKLNQNELLIMQQKQGQPLIGIEFRIINLDNPNILLPHNGINFGSLQCRGSCVLKSYYKSDKLCIDSEGWFDTGDIATIDQYGFIELTDRNKDVIKSGGEYISSTMLEQCAMNISGILEAAVIAIPHNKWIERPLLCVTTDNNNSLTNEFIMSKMESLIPVKWWMINGVVILSEMPLNATGKPNKSVLRKQFANYQINNNSKEK